MLCLDALNGLIMSLKGFYTGMRTLRCDWVAVWLEISCCVDELDLPGASVVVE